MMFAEKPSINSIPISRLRVNGHFQLQTEFRDLVMISQQHGRRHGTGTSGGGSVPTNPPDVIHPAGGRGTGIRI